MKIYSSQLEQLKVHLDYFREPILTQELIIAVQKQHEALIALSSKIHSLIWTSSSKLPVHQSKVVKSGSLPPN